MPLFTYKAVDLRGKSVMGRVEAVNLFDLEQRLSRMDLDLISGAPSRYKSRLFGGGVERTDLINFCFHLEQLANAGVPVMEGLSDLRESVENARFREVVAGLVESIEGGRSLSQALAEFQRSAQLFGDAPNIEALRGHALALAGKRDEAERIAANLELESRRRYVSGVDVAVVYCALGDRDKALSWLERGYRNRDKGMDILGTEPLFEGRDLFRRSVRGEDDLLLRFVQRVEGVEELFLRAFLAGDELDIIHQEHIHRAEPVAKTDHAIEAQRIDQFVCEFLGADVREASRRIALLDQMPDRLHQVRLSHSHAAI